MNRLTNQKQFWFLLSGGKNASFLTCWGATQRLPGCNSGSEPALLLFTWKRMLMLLLTNGNYSQVISKTLRLKKLVDRSIENWFIPYRSNMNYVTLDPEAFQKKAADRFCDYLKQLWGGFASTSTRVGTCDVRSSKISHHRSMNQCIIPYYNNIH